MTTQRSTNLKLFLQLAKNAPFNEFMKESIDFFKDEDGSNISTKKSNAEWERNRILNPEVKEVAEAVASSVANLMILRTKSTTEQLMLMVQNPFLWSNEILLRVVDGSNLKKGSAHTQPWLTALVEKEGKYQSVFWNTLFSVVTEASEFLPNQQPTQLFNFINEWFEQEMVKKDNSSAYKQGTAYSYFFHALANAVEPVIKSRADESSTQQLIVRVFETVGFNPYLYHCLARDIEEQITLSTAELLMEKLIERVTERKKFLSWPMFTRAVECLNSPVFHGSNQQKYTMVTLKNYVALVNQLALLLEVTDTHPRVLKFCNLHRDNTYITSKDMFLSKVFHNAWWPVVGVVPLTKENVGELVELQMMYYSKEWHKKFETITTQESLDVCLHYVDKIDVEVNNAKTFWPREEVFQLIAKSKAWNTLPVAVVIEKYYQYRSLVLYQSILKRSESELPNDWMREKHMYELSMKLFAPAGHSHERVFMTSPVV